MLICQPDPFERAQFREGEKALKTSDKNPFWGVLGLGWEG